MKKEIGIIGLGRMGMAMAEMLERNGYRVVGFNRGEERLQAARDKGIEGVSSISALAEVLSPSRAVIIAVPYRAVDQVLPEVWSSFGEGDTVIDTSNSFYKDSVRRAEKAREQGMSFIDVGISGGPGSAGHGFCVMVGGERGPVDRHEQLFKDLAVEGGFRHVGSAGAGHFVKMVHNGIEYGMMQSIAEGFELLRKSDYQLNLTEIAYLYNHGSVIESRLVDWLHEGFKEYGEELSNIAGTVDYSGMGEWTVEVGKEMEVETPSISGAYMFRLNSQDDPTYAGKILSLLRSLFGGHPVEKDNSEE